MGRSPIRVVGQPDDDSGEHAPAAHASRKLKFFASLAGAAAALVTTTTTVVPWTLRVAGVQMRADAERDAKARADAQAAFEKVLERKFDELKTRLDGRQKADQENALKVQAIDRKLTRLLRGQPPQ